MILCQNCLREYPDGTSYCDNCGESLVTTGPARGRKTARPAPSAASRVPDGQRATPSPAMPPPATPENLPPARAPIALPGARQPDQAAPPVGAGPTALVRIRLNNGKMFELKGKPSYLIGRRDEVSGIFPDLDLTPYGGFEEGVSRAHAYIHIRSDGCFVEDLASTNETLLNFHRLLPRQLYPLKDGDQLRFGTLAVLVIVE